MVHTFVSTQATRWGIGRIGVASFSVLAHASLITIAAVESGRPSSLYSVPNVVPSEHLSFVHVAPRTHNAAAIRSGGLAHAAAKVAKLLVPDLARLRVAVDASVATMPKVAEIPIDLDIGAPKSEPSDFGPLDTKKLLETGSTWALSHPGKNGAYTSDVVERVAWPQQDNPHPRYPDDMQRKGVEATFVVQFVVDSTGKVDAKTLDFPKETHPAFLKAVRDALLRSRYFPAELAGIRVRQLVQQQFTFVIAR
jgi:TonB family protein